LLIDSTAGVYHLCARYGSMDKMTLGVVAPAWPSAKDVFDTLEEAQAAQEKVAASKETKGTAPDVQPVPLTLRLTSGERLWF
jgi:hypothetical protein